MQMELTVEKREFDAAFRLLKKLCKSRKNEEAVLSFDGACLHIELGGMTVTPAAKGSWGGQVRVSGHFILGLAKIPPAGDPVIFRVADGRFSLGSSSVACQWQQPWLKQIELPMNPALGELLSLRFRYTQEEIVQSGLAAVVADAEAKTERKLTAALEALKEFHVIMPDLKALTEQALRRKYCL